MTINNVAELIFERWVASLPSRDRSKAKTPDNFDDLFSELQRAGVSFADANAILPRAIKAHQPGGTAKKNTWEKVKKYFEGTQAEFMTEWSDSIKASGTDVFFSIYPLKINEDDDGEPKVFGSMSVKEYRLQRKHADSYPMVNTAELVKRMKERQALNLDLDNVLGDEDE